MSWENLLKLGVGLTREESRLITSVMSDGISKTYDRIMDEIFSKKKPNGGKYRWTAIRSTTLHHLSKYYDKNLVGKDEFERKVYEYSRRV